MSHNPNRAVGNHGRRVERRYNPHMGHRRSRSSGPQGVYLADLEHKETTNRGWRVTYFKGDDFEVAYELIAARNATGLIKNENSDRVIRVLRGHLFILIHGEIVTVRDGQSYAIPKGTEYELSSDMGVDAEVIICQGRNYEEELEIIRKSDASNPIPSTPMPKQDNTPRREPTGKAMEAAQMIAAEKMKRQAARSPVKKKVPDTLPGQNLPGANLKPMGDPGPDTSE
jgi:mannose-6-phosphate isomerase-like protein (cupin superfamily)